MLSALRPNRRFSLFAIGLIAVAGITIALAAALYKPQITTWLRPGEYRTIQFDDANFLLADYSTIKIAGVVVGVVDSFEPGPNGTVLAHAKVEQSAFAKVGSTPSAVTRPVNILGGVHYIDIRPGGDRTGSWQGDIPASRTRNATELDQIVQAVQPDAVAGLRATVRQFDGILRPQGRRAVKGLLAGAPQTLRPAGEVLQALRGNRPEVDLERLVSNLQQTSAQLTQRQGQLESVLSGADATSGVFARTSQPVAAAIERLPAALDNANAGLARLDTTLAKLKRTAGPTRPTVQQLTTTLDRLEPVVEDARPVVGDLEVALRDTRPLVQTLVPTSKRTTAVLNDLRGPVLRRVNGPIKDSVLTGFDGSPDGPYSDTKADYPLYEAVAGVFSGGAKAGAYVDDNGHAVGFQPSPAPGSLSDVPVPVERMYRDIFGFGDNQQIGDGGE